MSTKTIKQRIALVAVTALTAGVFSVVTAPASNAGYGTNVIAATGTNPALAVADTLYIASAPSTTGSAVAIEASTTAIAASPATSAAKSLGLVNVSDLTGTLTNPTAGTTTTAVILKTGALSVYASNTSAKYASIVVTNGTIASSTGDSLNSTATVASAGAQSTVTNWGVTAKPNSGATSMTIQYYSGYAYATSDDASNTAVQANPTGATGLSLQGQISVTVTDSDTAGVQSASKSGLYGANASNDQSNTSDDAAYLGSAAFNGSVYLNVRVRDAFSNGITSTSGLLQVTATNGALVNLHETDASSAGTTSTDFATTAPDNQMIRVTAPSNAPLSTVVTATYSGVVIGTKTIGFSGKVAKIELYSPVRGDLGTATGNYAYYKMSDAAGNPTYHTVAGSASTAYTTSTTLVGTRTGNASTITKDRDYSLATNYSTVTSGRVTFTCIATAGSGTISLTHTNLDGSIVTSNTLPVTCAGDAVTYKASWDKAVYQPGDLATLTISMLDSKGNLSNDVATVTDSSDATKIPVVAIGGLDRTITGPTTGDAPDQGVITYKYTVGATEGTYSGKITFPTVDTRYTSEVSSAGPAAVTTSITVKSGTATVSNADVLKSIVSLIASINKQIQALQKLILKR
jgi:hypothetical protein